MTLGIFYYYYYGVNLFFIVQIVTSKGAGKSGTIHEIYLRFEENVPQFLSILFSCDSFCFDLVEFSGSGLSMKFNYLFIYCYDENEEVFICNGVLFFATLKYILLHKWPANIDGKLISNDPVLI